MSKFSEGVRERLLFCETDDLLVIFRGRSGLGRGPEHRATHRQICLSKAAQPSLTSADKG